MNIDHIHFYVEDAAQTRDWLIQTMGFSSCGQELSPHTWTELLRLGLVQLRVSSARCAASPVARYLAHHSPGVSDVAFQVKDWRSWLNKITALEIQILQAPIGDEQRIVIQGWGDLQHTVIANGQKQPTNLHSAPITGIDHIVLNVQQHQLAPASQWYQDLFDLRVQQSFNIQTDRSGLYSHALIDSTGHIQFNINEPSTPNSQIQTFLDFNGGSGIQHIALSTTSIFETVQQMQSQGLEFLPIPQCYYGNLRARSTATPNFPFTHAEWQALEASAILLDWPPENSSALLMQIFTQPIFSDPTFFFELIERRRESPGFGEGNFLALFQAIEQEELPSQSAALYSVTPNSLS